MEEVECIVCFSYYDDKYHRPRFMPCGHTMCSKCLERAIREDSKMCPKCRTLYSASKVEELPVNFSLESVVKLMNMSKSTKGNKLPEGSEQQLSGIDGCSETNKKDKLPECAEHQLPVTSRCSTHKAWICQRCHGEDHSSESCKIITISEEFNFKKSIQLNQSQSFLDTFKEKCKKAEDCQIQCKKLMEEYDEEINRYETMIKRLQEEMQSKKTARMAMRQLYAVFDKTVDNLKGKRCIYDQAVKSLKSSETIRGMSRCSIEVQHAAEQLEFISQKIEKEIDLIQQSFKVKSYHMLGYPKLSVREESPHLHVLQDNHTSNSSPNNLQSTDENPLPCLKASNHVISGRKVDMKNSHSTEELKSMYHLKAELNPEQGLIVVRNLKPKFTEDDIKNHFDQFGTIVEINFPMDKSTKTCPYNCYINYEKKSAVTKLLKNPNLNINGVEVNVENVRHGRVFVSGLKPEITDDDIKNHFEQFGTIVETIIPKYRLSNINKGFCFIIYEVECFVTKVLNNPKQIINGVEVVVKPYSPRDTWADDDCSSYSYEMDTNISKDIQRRIFVNHLKPELSDEAIKNHFKQFGTIIETRIPKYNNTNTHKGFCFITYEKESAVTKLLKNPNLIINGLEVSIRQISPKEGKIFVDELKPELSDEDITKYFEQFGTISYTTIPKNKSTNTHKGYCFITYELKSMASEVLKNYKHTINGLEVVVKPYRDYDRW